MAQIGSGAHHTPDDHEFGSDERTRREDVEQSQVEDAQTHAKTRDAHVVQHHQIVCAHKHSNTVLRRVMLDHCLGELLLLLNVYV